MATERTENSGYFWLPGNEDHPTAGVLEISDDSVELKLFGSFSGNEKLTPGSESYPLVLGELFSAPSRHGTLVTLIHTFVRRASWTSHQRRVDTLVANRVFVGDVHVDEKRDYFRLDVEITGLDEWLDFQVAEHFPGEEFPNQFVMRTRPPKTVSARIPEGNVIVSSGASMELQFYRGGRISRETIVSFESATPSIYDAYLRGFIVPFRSLVSLAKNQRASIKTVRLIVEDTAPFPPQVRDLTPMRPRGSTDESFDNHALFQFPRSNEEFEEMFSRWFELWRTHRRILGLVFGLLEEPPRFIETRFAMVVKAISLLRERIAGVDSLKQFLTLLGKAGGSLIGDIDSFCARVATAEKCIWDETAPPGQELFLLAETLLWCARIFLATCAGANADELTNNPEIAITARWLAPKLAAEPHSPSSNE